MKSRSLLTALTAPATMLVTMAALSLGSGTSDQPGSIVGVGRVPKITPDYVGIVIPPNVAPLNHVINEPGEKYLVRIHAASGKQVEVVSRTGRIVIPQEKWKDLLANNAGRELRFDVRIKAKNGTWNQYQTIVNTIAEESIDSYLIYRFMMPSSYFPKRMKICQRNLENFNERVVLDTAFFGNGCAHCHAFANNAPDKMLIGIRSTSFPSATLFVHDGKIDKIGSKFGYTAWHPSGKIAAYSMNDVKQFFHTARTEIHDVVDLDSAIVYYDVDKSHTRTTPAISNKQRLETYPAWTPDGKSLYFSSAPLLWTDKETVPPRQYKEVRYDLMRIGYDINTDSWGTLETVLSAEETGLSILLPRVSPDGRFLLFCMSEYGCFPIYQPSSDLYLMDLQTGKYQKPPINSDYAEAWHSWSSNSRWIVFSSKRQAGLFTRPYISYVDGHGTAHKPFVLPQEDPSFYESCCGVYSVPELIAGPVTVNNSALVKTVLSPAQISVNTVTGATPKANSTEAYMKGQALVQ